MSDVFDGESAAPYGPSVTSRILSARRFNPRPRVGGDAAEAVHVHGRRIVSIHAPAWGATRHLCRRLPKLSVSIHAPAWGGDNERSDLRRRSGCFNPRPRVGGDPQNSSQAYMKAGVSIHAPAWGATTFARSTTPRKKLFQSTPPRGGRRL